MTDKIIHDHHHDGIDRRGFLKCMAWVGTGLVYSVSGGVLRSEPLGRPGALQPERSGFRFAQISDSHIGFKPRAQ